MDWPLDTPSTGALCTALTIAVTKLLNARAKTTEANAQVLVLGAECEKTGVNALAEAREDLADRLDRVEAEHKAERLEWLAKFERQDRRLDVQEAALTDARRETTRIQWELDNAQAELRTTREFVQQLQTQNEEQAAEILSLRVRVRDLERELAASEGRAQKLADELHEKKRSMGAGFMSASPLTPIPPAPRVPKR